MCALIRLWPGDGSGALECAEKFSKAKLVHATRSGKPMNGFVVMSHAIWRLTEGGEAAKIGRQDTAVHLKGPQNQA